MNATEPSTRSTITGVRFGGVGGQGIVLAGRLLGKAASIFDGKDAVCTQSYGPEARGGASRADVVISDHSVDYPFVLEADILAVFFQEAYLMFRKQVKPGGLMLVDSRLVKPADEATEYRLVPATETAEELGSRVVANIVMLGYLVGATGVVSRESVEKAIKSTVKKHVLDLDLRAFEAGLGMAAEHAS